MASSYIFSKDEFVYLSGCAGEVPLCREQFEGMSELYGYISGGDAFGAMLCRSDAERSLISKGLMKFIRGEYVVEGVIFYIFGQMRGGKLFASPDRTAVRYLCEDMDVYLYTDRNNPANCCLFPCRRDNAGDMEELAEMLGSVPEFEPYGEDGGNEQHTD